MLHQGEELGFSPSDWRQGVGGETHAHHSEKSNIHIVDADDHIVEILVAAA